MKGYDDWLLIDEKNCSLASVEYDKMSKSQAESLAKNVEKQDVFEKIAYLKSLVPILKNHAQNKDAVLVLQKIEHDLNRQIDDLKTVFGQKTLVLSTSVPDTKMFCNNLKLSVQTCLEITELLTDMVLQSSSQNHRQKLQQIAKNFFEIVQKYVSLFGECRYRF